MLHEFLWKYRDKSNYIIWQQKELAEMLNMNHCVISTIFKELAEKKAVKKYGSKWKVYDPTITEWTQAEQDAQAKLFE